MKTARSITLGDVLRYTLLPGLIPRIFALFNTGFSSFAFFIALVYRAVRLLPDTHPFLNPQNIGKYGIGAVLSETIRYIKFNRYQLGQKNIDQIIVFIVVLLAIALLILQFIGLLLSFLIPTAMAFSFPGGASFSNPFSMFDTPQIYTTHPLAGPGVSMSLGSHDLSFIFLDRVFGVPGVFNSCIADGVENSCKPVGGMYGADVNDLAVNDPGQFPWPFHHALHGIFQFYSVGLLAVAVFLIIYFSIVVVVETAQTGTPFGKRFDTVWAPLRLVTAAGLLIPLSYGLNSGQYIVLYAAKMGANFATNGWIGFNQTIQTAGQSTIGLNGTGGTTATMVGQSEYLLAKPNIPDHVQLAHFFSVMHACRTIQEKYIIPEQKLLGAYPDRKDEQIQIKPYLVRANSSSSDKSVAKEMTEDVTLQDAVVWSNMSDVIIRYGVKDDKLFKAEKGAVSPICGELTISTTFFPIKRGETPPQGITPPQVYYTGATTIQNAYFDLLKELTFKDVEGEKYNLEGDSAASLPWNMATEIADPYVAYQWNRGILPSGTDAVKPPQSDRQALDDYFQSTLYKIIDTARDEDAKSSGQNYAVPKDLLVRGWAASGIWYNRIAEMNGAFSTAAWNLPKVSRYPTTMMNVAAYKQQKQITTSQKDIFSPFIGNGTAPVAIPGGPSEIQAAKVYAEITTWWQANPRVPPTGNVLLDIISGFFGVNGLFSIRENANVHPMAQLSTLGKSLVERSVSLLGMGVAATFVQPWIPEKLEGFRSALGVFSNFAFSVLSIGASAGFVLYYIIPLLPFIYFFFAVAGWVKAIFEAMVGVPLWALAHIRIDGNGLPGDAAQTGYFLILEIMLRPILIVFGLVASVTIYAASVHVLNDIFNVAVANVSGVDIMAGMNATGGLSLENIRGAVDTFFYTIMYVVIVYMLGMSSFKLIDLIPGSMLRWIGSGASAFQDGGEGAANQLVGYGTMGSQMVFGQLAGAARTGTQGVSETMKAMKEMGKK
jgi:conjugal transfer/type IV secretion protein DotA/TraY